MGGTPNIAGMIADPDFQGHSPADKPAALGKVTGDNSFASLNDGETMQFISRFQKPIPDAAAQAKARFQPGGAGASAVQYTPDRQFEMQVAKGFGFDPNKI